MRRDERVFVLGEDVGVYGGLQGDAGLPGGVRGEPRHGHAALGDRDRGRRDWSGADGDAPRRRDAVRRLRVLRLGPPRDGGGRQRLAAGTPIPIVLRLPSGGGFSSGPFHSQNPESSFAHIPGLKVVCPATPRTPRDCSRPRSRTRTPCCSSSTNTSTAGSRARCRRIGTPRRSARRAPIAPATTSR